MQPMKFLASLLAVAKPVIGKVEVFDAKMPSAAKYCSASCVTLALSS
jgi:hypothetical protein